MCSTLIYEMGTRTILAGKLGKLEQGSIELMSQWNFGEGSSFRDVRNFLIQFCGAERLFVQINLFTERD